MHQTVVGNGWVLKTGGDMHNGTLKERQSMFIVMPILYWLEKSLVDLYLTISAGIGLVLTLTIWSWSHSKRIYCGGLDWLHTKNSPLVVHKVTPMMRRTHIFIKEGVIAGLVVENERLDMKRGQSVG